MANRKNDKRLLSKIAQMYYEQGLSQQMIADRLRTSRPTISRMLEQARETGIVKIIIQTFNDRCADLEKQLENEFGLNEAAVVSVGSLDENGLKKAVGVVAAGVLQRIVNNGDVIDISWGTNLRAVVNALTPQQLPGVITVPLVGGMGQQFSFEIHSNSLVVDVARKYGGSSLVLHAPAIAATEQLKEAILQDPEVIKIIKTARNANIALVGIGAINESSTMIRTGFLTMDDFSRLWAHGAVGEVCSIFYDRNGQTCDLELNRRVIGLGPQALRNIKTVIAVAGGLKKEEALHAALRGQFVNILVTDAVTAEKVLLIESLTKLPDQQA